MTQNPAQDVALIVGGGPGISSSCARLFAKEGMRVAVAARQPDKPVLETLEKAHGVRRYACDAADPAAIELLFQNVVKDLGTPTLVVHNIDGRVPGIFRKGITEAEPGMAFDTLRNSAFSAFLVGQQAARLMRENEPNANGAKGTIIFTNASAALKGYPSSGAFAMACHAKAGLAESMARELMPQGIHIANVPIDAAIGWTREDGTRAHRLAVPFDWSRGLTIWIALGDLPVEMGALRFVSGSHRLGSLGRDEVFRPDRDYVKTLGERHGWELTPPCSLSAGDATVHADLTIHGTDPNRSSEARLAVGTLYIDPDTLFTGASYTLTDGMGLEINKPLDPLRFPILSE